MKRIISGILAIFCIFSLLSQTVFAYSLDIDYYVKNKKDDGYPSNNGKWSINYADTIYKYGVISKNEKTTYSKNKTTPTLYDVVLLLNRLEYIEKTGNDISQMENDKNAKKVPIYYKRININRATLSRFLSLYLKESNDIKINSIEIKDISDVNENTIFSSDIENVLEYGLLSLSNNKFNPYKIITNEDMLQAIASIINPYYRQTYRLYHGDDVQIQSNKFPMYYINKNEGINIEITNERNYNTDCFIAHVIIDDPAHFKTIYSNLSWSNYGMEINRMNEKIDPILLVNGDFRSPYIAKDKDLGIVRNAKLVRDKGFHNVLGMKKDGTMVAVNELNAQAVLDADIRETWTFGPWLVKDGKAVAGLDNGTNHPRTFIGQKYRDDGMLEYYIIVAEGRSKSDAGLSNYEMAQILEGCGVDIGYNLDGGGSSVMMFDNKLISKPSGGYFRADIDYIYIK